MAAEHSVEVARWEDAFGEVIDRIAPRFARYEPLRHAASLMQGLLAPLERKNCWTIAEHRGLTSPDALQHLLGRAKWDADGVRDDLRGYVADHLGDSGAILVIDETGDLKKGTGSVGVQRQYTGTAGRIENAQVAVYLTYAAPAGHAFIDRALYLPKVWAEDPNRRAAVGIPTDVAFATKPALATVMIDRAVAAAVPAEWVAGDEVYGADPDLRAAVRGHGLGYVLQIAANRQVRTPAGKLRVDQLTGLVPATAWQRHSAGAGTKGPRWYSWAWVQLADEPTSSASTDDRDGADPNTPNQSTEKDNAGVHYLLIRRNDNTGELAFHLCYSPRPVSLHTLVAVAGQRWRIEESFQAAKGLVGLDQHQVRRWTSWLRWTTLAMLAHAYLTITASGERERDHPPPGMIALTVAEFRRLFTSLLLAVTHTIDTLLAWSRWRRRHQARARECHYRRRQQQ
ncbi:MAG: IS701 family transposase [Dermatophilaceae bacterium]